jgi:alpha-ribazole phosphatase
MGAAGLTVWRHPRPDGAAGLCVGRTDLPVDARRAKRLAHRIRSRARREGWPRVVFTSPLQRSADVGRWLRRWGWLHRIDERVREIDFGDWDGMAWAAVGKAAVDAWRDDFTEHQPGGCGESVSALVARCRSFITDVGEQHACVVGHAGWINAARWAAGANPPPWSAADWPRAVNYGVAVDLVIDLAAG